MGCYGFGSYTLSNTFTPTLLPLGNDAENNDTYENAILLSVGESKTGHIGYTNLDGTDNYDWYVFTVSQADKYSVVISPDDMLNTDPSLYQTNGNTYLGGFNKTGGDGENDTLFEKELSVGTYYIKISAYGYGSYTIYLENSQQTLTLTADFSMSGGLNTAPYTVQFTDASTGNPTSWKWDFDNDGTIDSELQRPSYTYTTAGTYSVKLTVSDGIDSDSELKSDYVVVTAGSSTLSAAFSADKTTGEAPLIVQFTDASANATSWKWDFDNDGIVDSELQSPSYTYTTAGTYSVKLTVSDGTNSDFELKSDYVVASEVSTEFAGGDGSASNPWQIKTAQQLDNIRNYLGTNHKEKCFILMNDIDLTDYLSEGNPGYNDGKFWKPIGDAFWGGKFYGSIDGDNSKITNFKINRSSYLGLFGDAEEGSVIKNLGVEIDADSEISGSSSNVGGIAGYCEGTIENCFVIGNISSTASDFDDGQVGGIAGALGDSGLIIDCYSTNGIITGYSSIGGLVGDLRRGRIQNSYSEMTVSGNSRIGGLVGRSWWGTIDSCYATGAVTGTSGTSGGLVGRNQYGIITTSYASGNISGGEDIGGLVGENNGFSFEDAYAYIIECFASGNVSGTDNIGGLVGTNESSFIQNSYAYGKVTGTNKIGGFCGHNDADGVITNSYSYGVVVGTSDVGGLVGSQYQSTSHPAITTNSFWDLETSGQSASSAGTGKTSAEMKTQSTYTNAEWDFTTIWEISSNANNGYPDFKWHDNNASSNILAIAYSSLIKLFPNPASTQLTLETSGAVMDGISIYDLKGREVLNRYTVGSHKETLDISFLNSGIYMVKVMSGNSISIEKLIIK